MKNSLGSTPELAMDIPEAPVYITRKEICRVLGISNTTFQRRIVNERQGWGCPVYQNPFNLRWQADRKEFMKWKADFERRAIAHAGGVHVERSIEETTGFTRKPRGTQRSYYPISKEERTAAKRARRVAI